MHRSGREFSAQPGNTDACCRSRRSVDGAQDKILILARTAIQCTAHGQWGLNDCQSRERESDEQTDVHGCITNSFPLVARGVVPQIPIRLMIWLGLADEHGFFCLA